MSTNTHQNIGEKIKNELKERGLNQSAIAKKMNVSKQVINQIDRRKHFDYDFLEKLTDATGINFMKYSPRPYNYNTYPVSQVSEPAENNQSIEMSISIKFRSTQEEVNKLADFLNTIRKEALKIGFNLI